MNGFVGRFAGFAVLGVLLAGCAGQPNPFGESTTAAQPAAATTTAAATPATPAAATPDPEPIPERHEASAQCWMRFDKSPGTLEAKAALVDKCINDKMAGRDVKPKTPAKPKPKTTSAQ
jgi:hypothetical protein